MCIYIIYVSFQTKVFRRELVHLRQQATAPRRISKYFIFYRIYRSSLVINFENKLRQSLSTSRRKLTQNWRRQTTLFMSSYLTLYSTRRCLFTSYLIEREIKVEIKLNSITSILFEERTGTFPRNCVFREIRSLHFYSGIPLAFNQFTCKLNIAFPSSRQDASFILSGSI